MKYGKAFARLQRRRMAWDAALGGRDGFKRPGSFKKPFPEGRMQRHARRKAAEARMS